jgi:dipeptidyl aminopeptidase/acylaminoacyl peptidase
VRFQREAEALAALNHPNIAAIYGVEEAAGESRALVLELIEGPTLADRLAAGALPLADALSTAVQIARALEAAHAKGIVHRDLKPPNIKCVPGGQIKVLDFGLAKVVARPESGAPPNASIETQLSSDGVILGTVAYMSPEQARGLPVDARTDVWAFGCVLFEMLAGKPAFAGASAADTIGAVVRGEPDWSALPVETPTAIRRLLRRTLAKDPSERLHAVADARLEEAPVKRLQIGTPPTTDPLSIAISPDGRRVTFVPTSDGVLRLWLRPLDQITAQPLSGTDGASYPFWSRDSQSIGFFATGKLKRIDIGGGRPRILADAYGGRGGTWNRDGVILHALGVSGLRRVSEQGGETSAVTQLGGGQTNHRFPSFLPDGRRYLYFTQGSTETQGVYLGALDSPASTHLTAADSPAAYSEPGFLLFMRQGSLVARRLDSSGALGADQTVIADGVGLDGSLGAAAFSTSSSGVIAYRVGGPVRRQLIWYDRTGRQTGEVGLPDANNLQYPSLSRDGRRLAIDRTVLNNRDVYVADLAASGNSARLTFDADVDATPVWSPDGRRIVF